MLAAGHLGAAEAGADLEALGRRDREHGVCELGLELVEDGLAEAGGNATDDTGHRAANRVLGFLCADDAL